MSTTRTKEGLQKRLERICDRLKALDSDQTDELKSIGTELLEMARRLPDQKKHLRDLLNLAAAGLEANVRDHGRKQQTMLDAVAAALEAAQVYLGSRKKKEDRDAFVRRAADTMLEALSGVQQGGEGSPESGSPPDQAAPDGDADSLTLDDVASWLIQLEPGDVSALARVARALEKLSGKQPDASAAANLLQRAAERISNAVSHRGVDADRVLVDAGRLIQAAMDEIDNEEFVGEAETTTPATGAAQEDHPAIKGNVAQGHPSPKEIANSEVDAPEQATASVETDCDGDRAVVLPRDADLDLLGEFVTESIDYIEAAEAALLTLEADPEDTESVNTVFRAFHTIKGTSAFLGLPSVTEFAHRAESLLARIRDGEIRCTGGYADLALRSVDMLKELVHAVKEALAGEPVALPDGYEELKQILEDPEAAGVSADDASFVPPRLGNLLVAEGKAERDRVEAVAASKGNERIGIAMVRSEAASLPDVAKALRTQRKMMGDEASKSSVRVRTDRLDRLIEMVGELVIAHSMVAQDETVVHGGHYELSRKVAHAGKIVRELQDLSMSMRMVPLKGTFQMMARLVRDLSHKGGKLVEFCIEGEETEIDRNMVDILKDPLVHMVRNAVDHGIELPEVREAAGKPAKGVLRLSAYHQGGNVVVELRDDGKGLDRDRIVEKAVAMGVIESDKGMSDSEVFNLIFMPGFSTAEKVTDVSGRGVGMDVVKRNVEALRGRIEVASEPGRGTTFTVRLPLTLAVTDGMLVRVGSERYIIPTVNIYMSFRPEPEALSTVAGRGELVMFRGELMPIFRLHRLFEIEGAIEDPTKGLLVIVDDGDRHCALLVDELLGQQQVVAKSLGEGIGKIMGISGSAILGDGRVGLILDAPGIAAMAREVPVGDDSRGTRRRQAA